MIEYRLSPKPEDDDDDFDEGAELSLDDDMGDYGLDEEEDEEMVVPIVGPSTPAMIVEKTTVVDVEEVPAVPAALPAVQPGRRSVSAQRLERRRAIERWTDARWSGSISKRRSRLRC